MTTTCSTMITTAESVANTVVRRRCCQRRFGSSSSSSSSSKGQRRPPVNVTNQSRQQDTDGTAMEEAVRAVWYTPQRVQLQQQGGVGGGIIHGTSPGSSSSTSTSISNVPLTGRVNQSLDMGRYGLKRINYESLRDNPPVWTLPPHPPPKSTLDRVVFPLTLLIVSCLGVWVYLNPEEDNMRDYWKRVETGQILLDDDDDEYDDDDDDEEWEDAD